MDLSDGSLRHFLEVGNGKGTAQNTLITRFYTAWVETGLTTTGRFGPAADVR